MTNNLPDAIRDESDLDEMLSRPTDEVVALFKRLKGDIAIVGGAGKIGPSLVMMACRARQQAGGGQKIIVVDRAFDAATAKRFLDAGATTIACDLLDPDNVAKLPQARNVVFMVGMKFGTAGNPAFTWAVNGLIPAYVARHYRDANIVAFSTGCVYSLVPVSSAGSRAGDPLDPPGEYANSCVARERLLEFCSHTHKTPMVLFRLNYAVEMRYGVLVDIAQDIAADRPVDVTMGHFNCVWQGDVNAAVLLLLEHAACPPLPVNYTGLEKISIRQAALQMGKLMGKEVKLAGKEAPTALLSDAREAARLLGEPRVPIDQVIRWTAEWVARGGKLLGKPTHFQTRDGKY